MAQTRALFLDTTIQVDRVFEEDDAKKAHINHLLNSYEYVVACSYSRLEYKRVVLQNLALCLRYLVEEKSFCLALRRAAALGLHRPRRLSTLVGMLSWLGRKASEVNNHDVTRSIDEQLALRCESYIRTNIIFLWHKFDKSVGSVADKTGCARAREAPRRMRSGNLDVEIPQGECRKRQCNNANFLRSNLPIIRKTCHELARMEREGIPLSGELRKARSELAEAIRNPDRLYDYERCLDVGDVWIHLECLASGIKDLATTNYKESQHLCPLMGLSMRRPSDRKAETSGSAAGTQGGSEGQDPDRG